MDAVVFRETWKAIAVAINRHLYNEVATETKFSHQVYIVHVMQVEQSVELIVEHVMHVKLASCRVHAFIFNGSFVMVRQCCLEPTQQALPNPSPSSGEGIVIFGSFSAFSQNKL